MALLGEENIAVDVEVCVTLQMIAAHHSALERAEKTPGMTKRLGAQATQHGRASEETKRWDWLR